MNSLSKHNAEFLEHIIDDANVFVVYSGVDNNVSMCNKKVENITGKSKKELIGRNLFNVLYSDNNSFTKHQMFKAIMEDSITYKRPNNFEGLFTAKDNTERLISWSITPILSLSKDFEGILLVGNDMTESVEREASLRKIDETLKNIFTSIKEYALYVSNLEGNITYFGMGSEIMFGWQKNEIIFKNVNFLHSEEDTLVKLPFILEQVRNAGQYETEIDLIKKDKQAFPVILTVNKFLDKESRLAGYIFIAKDITERKKLEYQIIQSEKMAAIGQLAAGMAHEINNPLFVISGRIEMMLEEKDLIQPVKQTLEVISAQAIRIRKLVDQLLKFSRKTPPKFEVLNINDTIEGVLPLLSYHKLPSAETFINKKLEKGLPPIKGDLNQLQEVLVNLCLNAYQSMQEGGTLSIKTANFKNQYAEVRISDSGCGISEQNLKNVFMPFFSTKKEGTGLGLSICFNIIKNHNGLIDVESQLGKGTTFIIKLPFA